MRTPGVDQYRNRQADDRTYDVVSVRDGLIVGLHACRDRSEARSLAGIGQATGRLNHVSPAAWAADRAPGAS